MKLLVALTLLLTFGTSAHARVDANREARRVMGRYAKCVVKENHDLASRVLVEDISNGEIVRDHAKLVPWYCLPRMRGVPTTYLTMGGDLFRGALAEELIRTDGIVVIPANLTAVAPLQHREPFPLITNNAKTGKRLSDADVATLRAIHEKGVALTFLSQLGECVVRVDPASSRSAVLTEFGDAELSTMRAMAPTIAGCVPKGSKLAFTRTTLRAAIAINYYRLAVGSRAGTTTGVVR